MRRFIKKLQEIDKGSMEIISEKELSELKEFVQHKGYRIVAEDNEITAEKSTEDHIIKFPLTERDAVKVFKVINPVTYSRKTPKC